MLVKISSDGNIKIRQMSDHKNIDNLIINIKKIIFYCEEENKIILKMEGHNSFIITGMFLNEFEDKLNISHNSNDNSLKNYVDFLSEFENKLKRKKL